MRFSSRLFFGEDFGLISIKRACGLDTRFVTIGVGPDKGESYAIDFGGDLGFFETTTLFAGDGGITYFWWVEDGVGTVAICFMVAIACGLSYFYAEEDGTCSMGRVVGATFGGFRGIIANGTKFSFNGFGVVARLVFLGAVRASYDLFYAGLRAMFE